MFNPGDASCRYSFDGKAMREAADRMRAATCKCGHVGAECFNDSYCEPAHDCVLMDCKRVHRTEYNQMRSERDNALAEIDAMREAHKRSSLEQSDIADMWRVAFEDKSAEATATEIRLQNRITEYELRFEGQAKYIKEQQQEINDLQADYAWEVQAWQNVYRSNEEANEEAYQEQADQIEALETTIRVLSQMVKQ